MSNAVHIKTLDIFSAVLELYPSRFLHLNFNNQDQDLNSHLCNLTVIAMADLNFLIEMTIDILEALSSNDLN